MKASFFERLGAYIIDTILIGIIASLICYSLPKPENTVEKTLSSLNQKYTAGEITTNEFYSEYNNLLYQNQKNTITSTCVNLVLTIGYFVVFQYMNKGQTIGKKLLNIRVVDQKTTKPPTITRGLIRSLIVLGILSTTINLIVASLTNQQIYIPCYYILSTIETIFILVSIIMILFKKEGRGLHDIMAGTSVIKEGR